MNVKALVLAAAIVIPTAAQAATLSDGSPAYCPKASIPPLGRLICNTPQLWAIDSDLNVAFDTYVAAISDTEQKQAAHRSEGKYVLAVQARCLTHEDAVSCVQNAYRKRIAALGDSPQSFGAGAEPDELLPSMKRSSQPSETTDESSAVRACTKIVQRLESNFDAYYDASSTPNTSFFGTERGRYYFKKCLAKLGISADLR
jgi:uncharacterized protein